MKKTVKRIFSGVLSALTILTSVVQPMTAYAGETNPKSYEMQYPALEQVKAQLQEDEIVTVQDYEVEKGSDFDIKTDFSGMKFHSDQVKVTFYEAKNQKGQDFHTDHADTYQAVYFVEPVREAPNYHVIRNITVAEHKEKENPSPSKEHGKQEKNSEEEEDASQKEEQILTEDEFSQVLEESKKQDTYDEESGLGLYDVLSQAEEQEIDLFQIKEGETVTFVANASDQAARATQTVTITKGPLYRYQDYDLGTYVTEPYFISYGNVHATAYCIQPSLPGPGTGTYTITKIEDNQALAKVCYYGTEAAGKESYFAKHHSDFSEGKQFILTHIAAAYAYGSADAFYGANETAKSLAMEVYNYCVGKPEIPEVSMSFSKNHVKAYQEGQEQRTEDITFTADSLQSITMQLPKGVVFHNLTTGKNSAAGARVTLSGGTKFYLSAPLTQTEDVEGSWSATMQGSITKDYSAYKLVTNDSVQDLAFVFGEGVEQEQYVEFSVEWLKNAKIELIKKDQSSQKKMEGAVYGVYRDKDCTDLIVEMPATDKNGVSSVTIEKTQDTVYLKEISAPQGYVLDTKYYGVKLEVGKTVQIEVADQEQLASLTVYKEGEVLTGADVTEEGVTFSYTKEKQKGAVYDVYAEKEIVRADGTVAYKKGAVVKKGLKTGEDGSVTLSELPLGTYKVVEVKAPENFVCKGESQTVTLSYAGQNEEVVFKTITFVNDRQKASVSVRKEDQDTKNPLAGGIYGLYTAEDIHGKAGNLLVKKDTLIEKVTTGENGTASYQADLPIGYSYYIKELQAPAQYVKKETEKFFFDFQYAEGEEHCSFSHTFQNERVKAEIILEKEDAETGKTPQGDASLKGAVYGLYARENIVHPDGKTGVLYQKDEQVATLKTDDKGKAEVKDLYLGSYYIKEITPPAGYLLDETEHDVVCDDEGDTVAIVKRVCNVKEQVKKQPFQLIKAGNNGNTDAELLKGAGFQAYLESSLKKKEDGSYDFASATPVVIGENGATELFTDERGYACSIPLPYGTYVVRETTTPPNYKPVKDFIVRITEHKPDTPQIWRVLLDKEFEAKLKIVKKDDESKKPVLKKGTEFKVYDLDRKKYVEQVTTYPTTVVHKSYFTDETGYLILPQNLDAGHYRIEEVTAPDGYTLNENYYEVSVASDTAYQMEHNEYGASVAPVLVNGDGKVVAQDLENGLDQEAMKAIREYLEEKETDKKQEKVEISNASLFDEAEREAAYQIEATGQFFFIQETEEGYDYTFYNQEFQELDGGVYDTFDVTLQEAAKTLLLEEGADLTACRKIDSEMLQEQVERAEYFPQKSYEALKPLMESEENNVAFRSGYGYVMLQKILEGYECMIYDQAFREIGGQFYENITASKEEVFSQIFQEEGIGELPCEPFSYEELKKSVIEEEKKRFYEGELTPTSQIGIREEKLLRGESRQNIEEAILCYAQAELEEAGYEEITLLAARVYESRTRETLYREDSDLDVALSYTGDIREDAFFNLLQENGMRIAGLKIDINPISLEKTGTLQEYIKRAEQYLDEREAEKQGQIPQETLQEPQISFYAAECMEFPSMGEYYENLTLEEAVEKYKMIPSDRIHGIKGIGFCLKDGSIYDGEYELMSGGKISKDLIDLVPHYKESPLVQKAMQDLERILAEKQRENTAEQTKAEGTMGRKVSVLKALKERKELLKKQEKKEETSHTRKKEAEL